MKNYVSIIIPTYNAEKYIGICISSILDQSYPYLEVIIIDDGSTDHTQEIVNSFDDQRIKFFIQNNQGVSAARNKGLQFATGEYVTFIDSDDFVARIHIEKLVESIVNCNCELVICGYTTKQEGLSEQTNSFIMNESEIIESMFSFDGVKGFTWTRLFKRDIIKKYNISFNENISMLEDVIFNLEYLQYINHTYFTGITTYYYRIHEVSAISKRTYGNDFKDKWLNELKAYKIIDDLIRELYPKSFTVFMESYVWELNIIRMLLREAPNKVSYLQTYEKLCKLTKAHKNSIFNSKRYGVMRKIKFFISMYIPVIIDVRVRISSLKHRG
ncbi:glycosyltransferase family 2 protein [Loigolactobacillus jiayinensis]|uniref:Glycosyltransferase family 2 protein n=1 Tax=Loigolactobacillus jiayinensis TaxID=2486016 RepID=A0ABW1R9Y0_9LACO|nr:glycosyltransferase family 2 protein [Loigolactobacillus jiayinensis]